MANTITFEFSAEDRARLDRVAAAVEKLVATGLACYVDPTKGPEEEHPVADPFPATPAPAPAEEPKPAEPQTFAEPEPAKPVYTLADIQQAVVRLSAGGKKAEAREIIKSYADKVSAIPVEMLGTVMAKLKVLEG